MLPLLGDAPFSYSCNRCSRCCSGKRIRVNPYEVYRLARNRAMSTTEFLTAHTVEGGTELAVREDGACVFLTEAGCGVHPDRPLVCRIYPLGRRVVPGRPDEYFHLEPHPRSEGVLGSAGSVADYLAQQDAAPFMAAADRYQGFIGKLIETLPLAAARDPDGEDAFRRTLEAAPSPDALPWLDIDAQIASDGLGAPASAEQAMARHIAALDRWRRTFSPRGDSE